MQINEYDLVSFAGGLTPELHEQLKLLIETPVGTVVLDRDFGVDYACLDNPPPVARNMLAVQLAEKIERYIPRLRLLEVVLSSIEQEGRITMKVVVDNAREPV